MPSTGQEQEKKRDPKTGQFLKGNRTGGRKAVPEDLKEAFRSRAPDALDLLVKTMADPEVKRDIRVRCAEIILDRGYGKPQLAVDLTGQLDPVVFIGADNVPD